MRTTSTTAGTNPASPLERARAAQRSYLRLTWLSLATNGAGALALVLLVCTGRVDRIGVVIFALMFAMTSIGIEVGFHRFFSHRAFEGHGATRAILAIAGAMAMQGPVLFWTTVHRRHHRFSDRDGDPHSPRPDGVGLRARAAGLWHAHVGWQLDTRVVPPAEIDHLRYSRDLVRDRTLLRIDALYVLWLVLGLIVPTCAGIAAYGTLEGGLLGFLWGGPIRIFALDQVTWSLNSVCHTIGSRDYDTRDTSGNVWWHSLVSFGAGWHNNHHAFPSSATTGLRWWQIDMGYWVIGALARLGLAADVKRADLDRAAPRA